MLLVPFSHSKEGICSVPWPFLTPGVDAFMFPFLPYHSLILYTACTHTHTHTCPATWEYNVQLHCSCPWFTYLSIVNHVILSHRNVLVPCGYIVTCNFALPNFKEVCYSGLYCITLHRNMHILEVAEVKSHVKDSYWSVSVGCPSTIVPCNDAM